MNARLPATALMFILLPAAAGAQPLGITHSGFLLDGSDTPLSGEHDLVFELWSHPSGTTPAERVWQSDTCRVPVLRGTYSTVLGGACNSAATPLAATHLPPATPRWLAITIGGIALSPRLPMSAVPNAVQSLDAQALKADLGSEGTLNAASNPVAWTKLKGVPAPIADGLDADTTYAAAAGGGLALAGTGFSIADLAPSPAGTYNLATVTVDAKGRVTSAASGSAAAGTVTSIATGTGLTGGPISASGTIALAADGVASPQLAADPLSLGKITGSLVNVSAGNVGIGTTTANSKLSIGAPIGTGYALTANSTTQYGAVLQTTDASAGNGAALWVRTSPDGVANSTLFRVQNNGLSGVGVTTPTARFEVGGGALVVSGFANRGAGTGPALELGYDGTKSVVQSYDRTAGKTLPTLYNASQHLFEGDVVLSNALRSPAGSPGAYVSFFRAVKNVNTGTGAVVNLFKIDTGPVSFTEGIVEVTYGTRLQGVSDAVSAPVKRLFGFNKFNGAQVAVNSTNNVLQDTNSGTYAPVELVVSGTGASAFLVLRANFHSALGMSSFVWGEAKVLMVEGTDEVAVTKY